MCIEGRREEKKGLHKKRNDSSHKQSDLLPCAGPTAAAAAEEEGTRKMEHLLSSYLTPRRSLVGPCLEGDGPISCRTEGLFLDETKGKLKCCQ